MSKRWLHRKVIEKRKRTTFFLNFLWFLTLICVTGTGLMFGAMVTATNEIDIIHEVFGLMLISISWIVNAYAMRFIIQHKENLK